MAPTIEISKELYAKLEKLAVGFDTPEGVIDRLATNYDSSNVSTDTVNVPQPAASRLDADDQKSFIAKVFADVFGVTPRPFGQKAGRWVGVSDDNDGVQWNVALPRDSAEAYLGVNLEGMKYRDWPIARLLLSEKENLTLIELRDVISAADLITVHLTRDAWQAAARPQIKEKQIGVSGKALAALAEQEWRAMVDEALECLDAAQGFLARGKQEVTLEKSGELVERETSPHLTFRTLIWDSPPTSMEEAMACIEAAQQRLRPVYDWVEGHLLGGVNLGLYDEHESGYWAVTEEKAKDLVGKNIYLHKKQAGPSWHGGLVTAYRVVNYEDKPRVIFTYKPALPQKGVKAPSLKWGPYAEKLLTEDGIHLLHKDPKGLGLWGPAGKNAAE
ncbi:hypothetical protein EY643_09735 [Halioglobus maricola]|uniref:Uncharacterized protein n=1 Tax=Halioglobus maricola TaxID=2601894 RepID=A0A5P9NK05_9GAMM|nr:DNA-binding protein [Halioglobus maricola]QFU75919.1 hypothetical protein EY643_09735 [Halioglobus maricola]